MLEPDATIDTRLTNGRIVRATGVEWGGFVVRGGCIEPDRDSAEPAWRTVDASGFVVLPALVQPGQVDGGQTLAMARGGAATAIVTVESDSLDALRADLDELATHAASDYVVAWRVPSDALASELCQAGALAIAVLDLAHSPHLARHLGACDGIVRLSAGAYAEHREELQGRQIVVTTDDPEHAVFLTGASPSGPFVELDTSSLGNNASEWAALVHLGGRAFLRGGPSLLPRLFEFAVRSNGMTVTQVARLTSIVPAQAYGLSESKRGIETGADADVLVFDSEGVSTGSDIPGQVVFSLQRGEIFLYNDDLHSLPGNGRRMPR